MSLFDHCNYLSVCSLNLAAMEREFLIVNYNGGLCNKVIGDVYVLTVVDLLLFSQY